jgi:hypothetical protein
VCGTISAAGGRPPSRFALRRTNFDDARETRLANQSRERSERLAKVETRLANQSRERSERLAKVGWVFGTIFAWFFLESAA